MEISDKGLECIKQYEGLKLQAYPDPATDGIPWTIGYGHTQGVKKGDVITEPQAEAFLRDDLQSIYTTLIQRVKVPLSQGQFDALCSFIFNCGSGNFSGSTLLKKLNQGDYKGAAAEFPRWNKAAGKVLRGLDNRRASERQMFLS
ncbi:lysozyme [Xenorhabdus szentirmaii]|uniref:Lysozyme n=1 Tax=Xenorhabdus szentirmaii DSM 16338 TaxID=1427518 RepID=W1IXJ5_9GAMM|nr:lysozyme [Xenorhabdus szentirmaii]PHM33654.1 lysozyme [Xenorhabdus szentirmaii DSM 16338]PHM42308.1 lysozyme [Xenorhabdus szentirmaii]CDL83179.1 putative lysozyme [Xenorhabdus szentirmaii DSM 16338]